MPFRWKSSSKIRGQSLSGHSSITCSECYKCKSFPDTVSFTLLRLFVRSLVACTCYLSNLQGLNGCLGENNITDLTGSFYFPLLRGNISYEEEQFLFFYVMQNTITEFQITKWHLTGIRTGTNQFTNWICICKSLVILHPWKRGTKKDFFFSSSSRNENWDSACKAEVVLSPSWRSEWGWVQEKAKGKNCSSFEFYFHL